MAAGAAEWQIPYDRGAMLEMLERDLCPFVHRFHSAWPMDVDKGRVQRAIKQCIALNHFMETMPSENWGRGVFYQWLYPTVQEPFRVSTLSPLNLLNYVFLCMKSRYAAMAASAMLPSLYASSKPHATAGIVLQGWLDYVNTYGTITWKQFVNIVHQPLPTGRPTIECTVEWIHRHRDVEHPETIIFWTYDWDGQAPPKESPYATQ